MFRQYFYKIVRIGITLLLLLIFLGNLFVAIINPEALVFGKKLGGVPAILYLLINGVLSFTIALLFIRDIRNCEYFASVYFLYNLLSISLANFCIDILFSYLIL